MDNSTIILIILIIFFFLKKTRKCSYNKKENFIEKKLNPKRLISKNNLKVRNKLLERNALPKIKIDNSFSIKNARKSYQKSQKQKCYKAFSRLAMAKKSSDYIKNNIPIYCKKIFNDLKDKYKFNICEAPKNKARDNYFKTMQPIVYIVPSYNDQKLEDNLYADDYRRQFNSLYRDFKSNKINKKNIKLITPNTYLKNKNKHNNNRKISFINQFNVEFNYDIDFGKQFDSILN
jgi:hypothetical protein